MEAAQPARHPEDDGQPQDDNPPGFDTVWAILQELGKKQEELVENQKETNRQIEKLGNRMGKIVEHMIARYLRQKFRELGLNFPKANPNSDVSDYDNNIFFQIDIMLENDDKAMLVEVRTNLTTEDVKDHIKRIEKMRAYADLHGDKRTFLGSVAGVAITANVKEYALGKGLYVIVPSGETFNIIPPSGQPKEW